MSDKKKIIEQLKKDYKKSQGGLGGLAYSASPMASDKMFEKQADQILRSHQPNFQSQVPSRPHIDMEKIKEEIRREAAQKREWQKQKRERENAFLIQCLPEINAYREAMIKFSKEGTIKDVKNWYKEGWERFKELCDKNKIYSSADVWSTVEFGLKKELGDAYFRMSEMKKAKKLYLDMIKYRYDHFSSARYSFNYGTIWDWEINFDSMVLLFMNIGDYKTTASLFKEALKKDFKANLTTKSLREAYLGIALLAMGNIKKANKIFEKVKIKTSQDTALATRVEGIINEAKMKYNA